MDTQEAVLIQPQLQPSLPLPAADRKELLYRHIQAECTDIQDLIVKLEEYSLIGGEKQDAIDHVLAAISRLANEVSDSSEFLPPYDQRTYSRAIKALEEKLQETRSKIAPKKRFQFKPKQKNHSAVSIHDAATLAVEKRVQTSTSSAEFSMATTPANLMTPPNKRGSEDTLGDFPSFPLKDYNEEMLRNSTGIRKPSFSQATNVNISEHTGIHIILPSTASRATSSGALTRLDGCIVDMSIPTANGGAPFAGLAMKNIKCSLIIAGHVAGAAHITGVEDSILVVASRQVRMHECKNVDIYLHCSSRPIIEDCSNVRFSPIPHKFMSGFEKVAQNHWGEVDDFNWLKSEHSPNWSVLPENLRLNQAIWTDIVPGGPGVSINDIFKKIGLKK